MGVNIPNVAADSDDAYDKALGTWREEREALLRSAAADPRGPRPGILGGRTVEDHLDETDDLLPRLRRLARQAMRELPSDHGHIVSVSGDRGPDGRTSLLVSVIEQSGPGPSEGGG